MLQKYDGWFSVFVMGIHRLCVVFVVVVDDEGFARITFVVAFLCLPSTTHKNVNWKQFLNLI